MKLSTLAGLDGWRSDSINTDERGMRSSEDGRWDPATVIGLKRTDEVLVLGNSAFVPWLNEVTDHVTEAAKAADAEALLADDRSYDKVIVGRESSFSNDHLLRAAAMLNGKSGPGIIVFFPKDPGSDWQFKESLEFYFPRARTWESECTFGRVIMSEIHGSSWRMVA